MKILLVTVVIPQSIKKLKGVVNSLKRIPTSIQNSSPIPLHNNSRRSYSSDFVIIHYTFIIPLIEKLLKVKEGVRPLQPSTYLVEANTTRAPCLFCTATTGAFLKCIRLAVAKHEEMVLPLMVIIATLLRVVYRGCSPHHITYTKLIPFYWLKKPGCYSGFAAHAACFSKFFWIAE